MTRIAPHLPVATPLLIAALSIALALSPAAARAQTPDPKDLCKDGGFSSYLDPVAGRAFRNQGHCISFVERGGTLVPLPDLVVTKACTRSSATGTTCTVTVTNAGPGAATLPAGTVLLRDTFSTSAGAINVAQTQVPLGYANTFGSPCVGPTVTRCTITLAATGTQTLAPGQAVTLRQGIGVTSPGATITNTAVADPADAIVEVNEGNNSATVVTPPGV